MYPSWRSLNPPFGFATSHHRTGGPIIERRGKVVHKDELLDEVCGDRFVSEAALTTRIRSARRAVGDNGKLQGVIRTVHGKGYEFIADVHEITEPPPGDSSADLEHLGAASALPVALQTLIGQDDLLTSLVDDQAS